MSTYSCLSKSDFESLPDGTNIQFLEVQLGYFVNGIPTNQWKWKNQTFKKEELLSAKPDYFQYGRYRIKV